MKDVTILLNTISKSCNFIQNIFLFPLWFFKIFCGFLFIDLFKLEANYFTILWWFCHTLTWISHGCTCVPILTPLPPPSPSHPSGLSQCTGFECPVSCIKLGLVIYFTYGSMHFSMLFSQIILPSPSPTESKLCSLYLCLFCFLTYKVIITIFLNYIYIYALIYCIGIFLSALLYSV